MPELQRAWYNNACWPHLLRPVSALFGRLARKRRRKLEQSAWLAPVPVIIVGNISVGGSGKTPLTLALIEHLQQLGYRPGVVSRGYGSKTKHYPLRVTPDTLTLEGGDEPCLIARRTGVPLYIDPDRVRAAQQLLEESDCNVIVSDDGLQHYRLGRDIEICVVDGRRGFGNGCLMPEGPLREPLSRLAEVDLVVVNGSGATLPEWPVTSFSMTLKPSALLPFIPPYTPQSLATLEAECLHAVAGIGDPERFFTTLQTLYYLAKIIPHPLADHAAVTLDMVRFDDNFPLVCTEKDWVKFTDLIGQSGDDAAMFSHCWALTVEAQLGPDFKDWLRGQLAAVTR